jgi:hepatocyte growth factor-regulated tyrosine kinase substrate
MPLPHFGITQEVRVCDACHKDLTKQKDKGCVTIACSIPLTLTKQNGRISSDRKGHRSSHSVPNSRSHRSARAYEDAELQRAIQLSLQEVGTNYTHGRPGYTPSYNPALSSEREWTASEPPLVDRHTPAGGVASDDDDPELKAAIEASLREANAPRPSAPIATPRFEEPSFSYGSTATADNAQPHSYPSPSVTPTPRAPLLPNYDLTPLESDTILTFSQTVERVQAQGGRDMSRYPAVTELLDKANGIRPKLAMSLDDAGRKEGVYAFEQPKVNHTENRAFKGC